MKITKATDYGFRVVVQVVMNPDDSQWVHKGGLPHTPSTARGPDVVDASGNSTPGAIDRNLAPGTECHACRNNWYICEVKWDGDELYIIGDDGIRRLKTGDELKAEIIQQLVLPSTPKVIGSLINVTL